MDVEIPVHGAGITAQLDHGDVSVGINDHAVFHGDDSIARSSTASSAREDPIPSKALREAVLRLPEDLRFTVTAHFWGGLAVKEIAAIEEITTVAIRKRLHKAFSLLEQALGGNVEEERQ